MSHKDLLKLTIKLFLVISLLSGVGFCFPKSVKAQEETSGLRILYQGSLLGSEGKSVEDGNYNMRFLIYDSETGGNILWQEEYAFYNALSVKNGQFKTILGRTKPINLKIEQGPFWLGIALGNPTEEGEIVWNVETPSRKKIILLSELLKEEGLEYLNKNGLTEQEWEQISQIIEKKMGEQPEVVFLFDLGQLDTTEGSFGSKSFDIIKNFINFVSEKVLEIESRILEISGKIDEILKKTEEMASALLNIGEKIDRLYQILVVNKGLGSEELPSEPDETKNYTTQKFESLIIKQGESSIRIFNQSIKAESLIFVSFLDDPGSAWWISEKVPASSFNISLKEPAPQDLRFDYWILDEEENQQPSFSSTTGQNQLPEEQTGQPEETEEKEQIEFTTTSNQTSSEEIQPVLPEQQNQEQSLEPASEELPI